MSASHQFSNASDQASHPNAPLPLGDEFALEPAPPPRPAILLGLAFGASAGLMSALYFLIF